MASALPNDDDDDTVDVEEDRGIEEKSNAPDDNDPLLPVAVAKMCSRQSGIMVPW
jgi:hypothetical protein